VQLYGEFDLISAVSIMNLQYLDANYICFLWWMLVLNARFLAKSLKLIVVIIFMTNQTLDRLISYPNAIFFRQHLLPDM